MASDIVCYIGIISYYDLQNVMQPIMLKFVVSIHIKLRCDSP